jgi:hypothetical protein
LSSTQDEIGKHSTKTPHSVRFNPPYDPQTIPVHETGHTAGFYSGDLISGFLLLFIQDLFPRIYPVGKQINPA